MSAPHWRNSSHEEQTGSHGATSGWRLSRLTLSSSTRQSQLLTDSPAEESTRMTVCSLLTLSTAISRRWRNPLLRLTGVEAL
jgi:hypothetical protein